MKKIMMICLSLIVCCTLSACKNTKEESKKTEEVAKTTVKESKDLTDFFTMSYISKKNIVNIDDNNRDFEIDKSLKNKMSITELIKQENSYATKDLTKDDVKKFFDGNNVKKYTNEYNLHNILTISLETILSNDKERSFYTVATNNGVTIKSFTLADNKPYKNEKAELVAKVVLDISKLSKENKKIVQEYFKIHKEGNEFKDTELVISVDLAN